MNLIYVLMEDCLKKYIHIECENSFSVKCFKMKTLKNKL